MLPVNVIGAIILIQNWIRVQNMNHYILIAADIDRARLYLPSAYDIAMHRLEIMKWGLNNRTFHRKRLTPDDKALIYISGRRDHCQNFVGEVQLASAAMILRSSDRKKVSAPSGEGVVSEYYVNLKNVNLFNNNVSIREIATDLDFIKRSEQWWRYMQGGVIRISGRDWSYIVNKSK
ncbi:EVE domain-containing protein [Pontiellaceae bacterium B1224]|nr:EVE domain-containing protein [Pontiellaceae bacterium B1224]